MLGARYDRNADLVDGRVPIEGIELDVTRMDDDTERQRLGLSGAFDVWEAFMGRYLMEFDAGRREFVAIPVFIKRNFRHSSIYVRRGGPIAAPDDLRDRRVGIQHWATTAAIWAKGILVDDHGVDLASITWVQTSPDEPAWRRPPWLRLDQAPPGRALPDLLRAGDIDAAISSAAWVPYEHPDLACLFPDHAQLEREYFARTRIFPIMHTLVVRAAILDADPWVAPRLFEAWSLAKQACQARLERDRYLVSSMWFPSLLEEERTAMGSSDTYPWGLRRSRHEVAKLVEHAFHQGIVRARWAPEDLFHPSTRDT